MEIIKIAATEDTPNVVFDHTAKVFEISGRSLPEDVVVFYQPVIKWLEEFASNPFPGFELSFKLEYFNTASSKLILDILLKLEEVNESGSAVKVKWYYLPSDADMKEAGEEYSEIVSIPFEVIAY